MNNKLTIIIQARMSSTRLPGKVMLELAGKPVLWHIVTRCGHVDGATVVVATSTLSSDDVIAEKCKEWGVLCVRGDIDDVLSRYRLAASAYPSPTLVRITADCPLVEPNIIKLVTQGLSGYDYASNVVHRTIPHGLDVEAFTDAALKRADESANSERFREHVTLIMRENPLGAFTINDVVMPSAYTFPSLRLTLDTAEDYELFRKIYDYWYKPNIMIPVKEVLQWLTKNPDIASINTHVQQKNA